MSNNKYGRVYYSTIVAPDEKRTFYYSYLELQDKLNELCREHTLKKAYVNLESYLEAFKGDNLCDFSYIGRSVILLFDNIALEICVHAVGMIECRTIRLGDIEIKSTKDFPPSNMGLKGDNSFYDLGNQFELSYEGQGVISVSVDETDCYPFSLEGFDEEKAEKAAEANSLPENIRFKLENGVEFGIYADAIEWFYVELKNS